VLLVMLVMVVMLVVLVLLVMLVMVVMVVALVLRLACEDDRNISVTNKSDDIRVKINTERRCTILTELYPLKQAFWTFDLVRANCAQFDLLRIARNSLK